jgi:hypothetical protein
MSSVLPGFNVITANNVICINAAGADVDNSCYIGQIFGQPVVSFCCFIWLKLAEQSVLTVFRLSL